MKVAICVPFYADTKALFTLSLARLLTHSARHVHIEVIMAGGWKVDAVRNQLGENALAAKADFILWLDVDQAFPPHTLERLLRVNVPVVGCNIARRTLPTGPTAAQIREGAICPVWTTEAAARQNRVDQVHRLGLGVCLMKAEILNQIERPWFQPAPEGEDWYFFQKLEQASIPVFVDHALSWSVGHIGERVFTIADTLTDKEAWLRSMNG